VLEMGMRRKMEEEEGVDEERAGRDSGRLTHSDHAVCSWCARCAYSLGGVVSESLARGGERGSSCNGWLPK